ncbi:AAA family ATPase [Candidatus Micrarchaeota archaeon]|nr:AAA family ATPase [Candidatus Micrarchaeota archaeon]
MLWLQKHAPSTLQDFLGNPEAVEEVARWSLDASRGKRVKPLLLHGPPGTGKTTLVHLLARENGWNLVESNAADLRDANSLERLYGASMSSAGLYGQPLLFIDEVDSVADRKEFPVLQKLLKESLQPVILVANDVWNSKLSGLRFTCKLVPFKRINSASIRKRLKHIAKEEGLREELAEQITALASGDVRSAINDLQALAFLKPDELAPFESELEHGETPLSRLSGRDRDENQFNAVRKVFKTMHYQSALDSAKLLNTIEFDFFLRWLEQNIPAEYEKSEEIAEAFHWLSRADMFQGRIRSRQHWGYLRYVRALSLAGVALSKKETYRKFTKYEFPQVIRQMGSTRAKRASRRNATSKAAARLHVSLEDANDALARLSVCEGVPEYLDFSDDEADWMKERFGSRRKKRKKSPSG